MTLPTPEENLACDEALLDWCEDGYQEEILRCWVADEPFVVLGYSSTASADVNLAACRARRIPVLRRCSGGGAVLQGPGCFNFTLVLTIPPAGPLNSIRGTTTYVLRRHQQALGSLLGTPVGLRGVSDLTLGERKFSGNAQRRKRRCVLFHGTFLFDLNLALVDQLLAMPSRQPAYRQSRSHQAFLANIPLGPARLKALLRRVWDAEDSLDDVPRERIEWLVEARYQTAAWNLGRSADAPKPTEAVPPP